MSGGPIIRGRCPGARLPMASGDGLVIRVRPRLGELSAAQALGLCDLAARFGTGTLELTSRANLQIRGIAAADHPQILAALDTLGLLDADPAIEARRNILTAPGWQAGDLTERLHDALVARLGDLPPLPAKLGLSLDLGAVAQLDDVSADFRFELSTQGGLILRADGAATGRALTEAEAPDALIALAEWFVASGGPAAGRMARHLRRAAPPPGWLGAAPRGGPVPLRPGLRTAGGAEARLALGAPFGEIRAAALRPLLAHARAMRLAPGRVFELRGGPFPAAHGFIADPQNPLLRIHACPGAPFCPQAEGPTRALARSLAGHLPRDPSRFPFCARNPRAAGALHVSGCAKGCAHPFPAAVTLVARAGLFDLIEAGAPGDAPTRRGLSPLQLRDLFGSPSHAL